MGSTSLAQPVDVPSGKWAEAVRREPVIRRLCASERTSSVDVGTAARELGLSRSQIYRLIRRFRENPVAQSLVPANPGPKNGDRRLSAKIEEIIDAAIETDYKRRERPTIQHLLREIRRACRMAGLNPPSRKAISTRLAARSIKEITKSREGAKVAHNRFAPVRQGLRPSVPLEIVQIDHTKVDIQLVDEHTRKPLGRPWLTLLLDVYSRSVLGFTISLDAPSAAGVGLAMAQGVLPKTAWLAGRQLDLAWPMFGIPKSLHLDNGREFHSHALIRGCQEHGIAIDYRPPGTPRFGGHIERLMGTLMRRVHALPGSTSSNVVERGEYLSEEKAVLTLGEFERIFALDILGPYHNDLHSELGKTPIAAWTEGIAAIDNPRLPPDPKEFVLHFLPSQERVVGRTGVRLFNIMYYDDALASVLDSTHRKRRVKYNPGNMSTVFIEMSDRSHLPVRYADLRRPPISLWEHRFAVKALKEQGRKTVDEEAIFEAIEGQRRILEQAKAASKAARRDIARLPKGGPAKQAGNEDNGRHRTRLTDENAKVPQVVEDDAWKTRILS